MATDHTAAFRAFPLLCFPRQESINTLFLNDPQILQHTHMVFRCITFVHLLEFFTGKIITLKAKTGLVVFELVNLDMANYDRGLDIKYLKENAVELLKETRNLKRLSQVLGLEKTSSMFDMIETLLFEIIHLDEENGYKNVNDLKESLKKSELYLDLRTSAVGKTEV